MIESRSKRGFAAQFGKPTAMASGAGIAALLALALTAATPARAEDGCTVLLCLAAPSWRAIPECVPPVRQVLHDLARGKPLPSCAMAGDGNGANHAWSAAPDFCPPQYTREFDLESGKRHECDYSGVITVTIDGAPFARTWWSMAGDAVTEFSMAAKIQLGSWDPRFDDEYAAWRAALPPRSPADPT